MKILKRNQLIILVISLMLITAGYLNFTASNENVITSTIGDRSDTKIGDAELVSTIPKEDEISEAQLLETNLNQIENVETNSQNDSNIDNENSITQTEIATAAKTDDYYFTNSKLERNIMYSESLETYQEIYNNANATAESKKEAISKINNISNTKNAIMIAENLIMAKGFEDVVIFVNEQSVSVVIKTAELKQEEVAQIQNIVSRELNVEAEKIHISNKT